MQRISARMCVSACMCVGVGVRERKRGSVSETGERDECARVKECPYT
ncbi:MAG TPA: hypothetical protein V6C97_02480 [Oculatellaceae cyanobacterium]